jgi:hypothetical protein
MRFVWFWTFWHWSKESFRSGALLRNPLEGIAGHWDEWFRHEASENDLKAIEEAGRSSSTQREFIAWIFRHWSQDTEWRGKRLVPRFVVNQLAGVPPFHQWSELEEYRTSYTLPGVSALVLGDQSGGTPEDVRPVEAILLPANSSGEATTAEGFQPDAAELADARSAAQSLLGGKALLRFLLRWILSGKRPYSQWVSRSVLLGWLVTSGLILFLLLGPEPGDNLYFLYAALVGVWGLLVVGTVVALGWQCFRAWRTGVSLRRQLDSAQLRLRMNGGLTLKGGSAGLPFCLNILLALYRACPESARDSWIWRRFFAEMHSHASSWAGTGVITADGRLAPVVLEPKLQACAKRESIRYVITPRQRGANQQSLDRLLEESPAPVKRAPAIQRPSPAMRLGFAAEKRRLQIHPCRHIAQAMMAIGCFDDRRQVVTNLFAIAASATILMALPDLRSILLPPPAPMAVEPGSSSPYYLWISLDTTHPEYFSAVLESGYWSNRRSDVKPRGGVKPSVRAEIQLHRLIGRTASNNDDGVVWIERRRRFLTREFLPGERVGRYSIAYLTHIGHE